MLAQQINRISSLADNPDPLELVDIPIPRPGPGELLLEISVCGVCHTELDIIEGRTPPPHLPLVPGHQVVGRVSETGPGASKFAPGDRLGVAWIFSSCGECVHCLQGEENLCSRFLATGRDANGGYAQSMVVSQDFAFPIPSVFSDHEAAPLLCAGAVGYRSLRLAGMQDGRSLGFTGFGASAHIVLQLARYLYPNSPLYVFTRSETERLFALQLGAQWAGGFDSPPPALIDRIIDTTPVWKPVLFALQALSPGGRLVINAIRKESSDNTLLSELDYTTQLWQEKEIKSVANVTRQDVTEFLDLAAASGIKPEFQVYPLQAANQALRELKGQQIRGAKVLVMR